MNEYNLLDVAGMSEDEARELLEEIRWPNGIYCPKCGSTKGAWEIKSKPTTKAKNRVTPGTYKCKDCRKKFTVRVGTIFEDSKIPLNKWLAAIFLMNAAKNGISAHELHRQLDITYKSAWFLAHRIRFAMTEKPLGKLLGIVEADETYIGGLERNKHKSKRVKGAQGRSKKTKTPVFALVERGGDIRAQSVANVGKKTLRKIMKENVHHDAHMMTDLAGPYKDLDVDFLYHDSVDHSKGEYGRGNVHTNTLENWFSQLKRGIDGTHHHVSKKHLDRYVEEFAHRYNTRKMSDWERAEKNLKGTIGKRLVYADTVKMPEN
jgi:transposase-like protein